MLSEWLPYGILGRPHGVAGEVALDPFNRAEARRVLPAPLEVQLARGDQVRNLTLVAVRPVQGGLLLRFAGVETRDDAAALVGHELRVARAILAAPSEGEFFLADTLGCEVVQTDGTAMGRVTGTFWNGAHDVLTILAGDGSEHLVPAVPACIRSFDPQRRLLVVDYHA